MSKGRFNDKQELIEGTQNALYCAVRTGDETEFNSEFRWNLPDDIRAQIARFQFGVSHQMVNGIWNLY